MFFIKKYWQGTIVIIYYWQVTMKEGEEMKINIRKFQKTVKSIQKKEKISNIEIASIMELDYSYVFRIFKSNKEMYSSKVINGIERFCKHFNIDSKDYIFLE